MASFVVKNSQKPCSDTISENGDESGVFPNPISDLRDFDTINRL
jgi:hypothetical protein